MGSLADPYALRCVSDLPPPFRSMFRFRYFNSLQSECFHVCFFSDVNMVISAPTGSGKTVLFELCILRLLSRFLSPDWRFNLNKGTLKTIYIAPSKALVQEKLRDWNMKLGPLGINCLEMTGDGEFCNTKAIHDADLILTTPEKFDSMSRHGIKSGRLGFFCDIALVLIDEVHLLNDPRGAALEAVVSRIKMLSRHDNMKSFPLANVRLIAVSATIPNIEDIGYAPAKNDFLFERKYKWNMDYRYTDATFKGEVCTYFLFYEKRCNPVPFSVGFHNGGLCLKDRGLVEGLFLKGDLQVLCTTNTLAHGVNLPAHTVVIKSTQFFNKEKGLYVEYERSMVLQMCGRAGRPPFDDTGTIIIMTRKETVHLYENLLNGCEMVESQLLSCAVEHLNAEIVQLTVSDIILAVEWIKCSYLYIRIRKNPENYGVKRGTPQDLLEKQIQDICVDKIHELVEYGLIWTDEGAFVLQPLGIQLRRNDKKILNDINADKDGRLLFHIVMKNGKRKKRVQTREEKIFLLANDCLTGDSLIHDLSLNQETNAICSNGCRIAKCMREYFIYKKNYRSAINSMILANSLHQKLWESSPFLLKQLPGIGIVTAKALKTAGVYSFETLATADARKIELATGRNYPFGNHIKESMSSLPPKIDIHIEETGNRLGKSTITVTLTRVSQAVRSSKRNCADMVVASEEDNVILFHENIRTQEFHSPYSVKVFVPCPQNARVTLKVDLIFEEYVGLDVHKKHVVNREDDLHVTKERGIDNLEPTYNIPSEICLVSSRTTRTSRSQSHTEQNPLSKEVYVIEDDAAAVSAVSALEKADDAVGTIKFNNLASLEVPSFDLLPEEEYGAPGPAEAECKGATDSTIFDHIRKKSKDFPTLMLSKSMDCSYEPLILKKMKISRDQFGVKHGCLHAGEATTMDFDPVEPRVFPTNTAEKFRGILGRSSERSRMLFGKMDSPFEKSEMLGTTPAESSLRFAGGKDSSLEKNKTLIRTPAENSLQIAARGKESKVSKVLTNLDKSPLGFAGGKESKMSNVPSTSAENSLQFAARRVRSSEKSKMLTTPYESSQAFLGEKDSPSEKSKILINSPVEYPFKKGSPGENPFKTCSPVENSPKFAAQRDSPSEKRKSCISNPLPPFQQAVQCTKQVGVAGQPFDIKEYCKEILRSRNDSQGGDPFAGYKSIFSFL
ncbi:ATP-dependent DNA helicase MER3 [Zea mays]|uniref:DNA 3'-5' helicase n=1 Tax=Zea mays TaxID=4577 RepID=A0A3L6F4U2_MAIZE|nr:ATP-dependent DNA helicase MER3 [Zea mays]